MKSLEEIKNYAIRCHAETNHMYDKHSYSFHLCMVVTFGYAFIDLIPNEDRDMVIAGLWCHDLIEDTRQTYNDVAKNTGSSDVADLAYVLTNEKGRNRSERANPKYYTDIRESVYGTFAKLCDRLANVAYSKLCDSSMYSAYKGENSYFVEKLYNNKYHRMFQLLDELLEYDKTKS